MQEYINKLCEHLSIEKPKKEKDGYFLVPINDEVEIKIWSVDKSFYFHSNITKMIQKKKETLLIYLMKANLLGQGTGPFRIGLDKEEKFLTLSYNIDYEVKYIEFKELLEDFVNYIYFWRKEIEKIKKNLQKNIL